MNDKLGRGWMQARGSFKGGLLWVWPPTLWTFKCHIDTFTLLMVWLGGVWYMHLKTENCCLKTCVEIRVGEKMCENTCNAV